MSFRHESHIWQGGSHAALAKLELMGSMMGISIDAPTSRMNAGDSEDTASANHQAVNRSMPVPRLATDRASRWSSRPAG